MCKLVYRNSIFCFQLFSSACLLAWLLARLIDEFSKLAHYNLAALIRVFSVSLFFSLEMSLGRYFWFQKATIGSRLGTGGMRHVCCTSYLSLLIILGFYQRNQNHATVFFDILVVSSERFLDVIMVHLRPHTGNSTISGKARVKLLCWHISQS